jgi:hypothetical protein
MSETFGAKIKKGVELLNPWLILIIFLFSIYLGYLISYTKAESLDLIVQRDSIELKKECLSFQRDLNQVKQDNALYLDRFHIQLFRDSTPKLDLLTIGNDSRHHCEIGEINGCWKKEIDIYKGNTIAVQVHYHNMSPVSIKGIYFSFSPPKYLNHSIRIEVIAKIDKDTIAKDIVIGYFHNCNALNILEGKGDWSTTTHHSDMVYKKIDELKYLINQNPFSIGDFESDTQGAIVFRFIAVEK